MATAAQSSKRPGWRRETAGAYLKAAGSGCGRRVRGDGGPRKTGQRERGDHRVGRGKTDSHDQPQPHTENLSNKEKAKPANANAVTTGFGVESTAWK